VVAGTIAAPRASGVLDDQADSAQRLTGAR
jgi:hypothetical protein